MKTDRATKADRHHPDTQRSYAAEQRGRWFLDAPTVLMILAIVVAFAGVVTAIAYLTK